VTVVANKLHLEIISPDRIFLDEEVETAVVRTATGDVGLLNDHLPMVTPLAVGRLKVVVDGKHREAACAGGIVKIRGHHALVITEAAEWIEEIDVERARKARERAENRLQSKENEVDLHRAKIALTKALNRIKLYEERE